jgi:hypothetical protein
VLTDEQKGEAANEAFIKLNKGINKGYSWDESLKMLVDHYEKKKSGATAPEIIKFDYIIEIYKNKQQ